MTKFKRFQPTLFEFLEQLADNNNRPWFQENKWRYERDVLEPTMAFIRAFQPRLKRISSYFVASDRRVEGSLMRVYRGTRFHKNGEPYKTNVGIQFRHEQGRGELGPADAEAVVEAQRPQSCITRGRGNAEPPRGHRPSAARLQASLRVSPAADQTHAVLGISAAALADRQRDHGSGL
jgi:hypothetical protein